MLYTRKPVVLAFVISALAFSSAWAQAPNPPWQFCIDGSCSALAGPDTPVNFSAVSGGATTINLSWAPGGNGAAPDDYDLDFSATGASGPWTAISIGLVTSYSHTGRTSGVRYYYRLRAKQDAAASGYAAANAVALAPASRVVYYNGDFASGTIPDNTSLQGGGYVGCKFEPQGGVDSYFSNSGGGILLSGMTKVVDDDDRRDMRVLSSEVWNGETITPRSGSYFMRQAIYYTKEYESLNGDMDDGVLPPLPSGSNDRPRVKFDQANAVYQFEWDQELWLGFSLRLPTSHIGDIATKGNSGGTLVWVLNAGASFTQIGLNRYCASGETVEKWWLHYQLNATALADLTEAFGSTNTVFVDLGATSADEGKWTDFVLRIRLNPFATATNASSVGGKDQVYQGNKGILQVWKGTGAVLANGNRTMTRFVNVVNAPVGGVPHAANKLQLSHRMYKYSWKKNATTSTAPIYHGWDDIRWGFGDPAVAASKGQSRASVSSDVSPSNEVLQ